MLGYAIYRHWHAPSEPFTGSDSLITALQMGWTLSTVSVETYSLSSGRSVDVYQCELTNAGDRMVMPVIHNPHITQLIEHLQKRSRADTVQSVRKETSRFFRFG